MTPAVSPIVKRWWLERRLRVETLPRSAMVVAVSGLLAAAMAGFLLLGQAFDLTLPGGKTVGPNDALLPRVTMLVVFAAVAASAACFTQAGSLLRRPRGRLLVAAIGIVGALIATPSATSGWTPSAVTGWVGVAAGFGLALVGLAGRVRSGAWAAAWATIPVAAAYVAMQLALLSPLGVVYQDLIAVRTMALLANLQVSVTLLALWSVIEGGRALLGSALTITRGADQAAVPSVGALLAVKLTWLALAHLRLAPPELGGADSFVGPAPHMAPVAWLLAAALAGAVAFWLLAGRRSLAAPRGITGAGWIVIVGLVAFLAVSDLLLALLGLALDFTGIESGPARVVMGLLDLVGDLLIWAPAIAVALSLVAGLALLRRAGARAVAVFLLAFAVWSVPLAASVTYELVTGTRLSEASGTRLGGVDPAVLDAMVTVALAVVFAVRAIQRRAVPVRAILVLLVVSGVVAYGPRLIGEELAIAFWAGLVFPVVIQFGFDSRGLNRPRSGRSSRVLLALGVASGSLAVTLLMASSNLIGPNTVQWEALGRALILVPFVAMLTAAALSLPPRAAGPAPPAIQAG